MRVFGQRRSSKQKDISPVAQAASEEHISELETDLKAAIDQEAEAAQRFDDERKRQAALNQELHVARRALLNDAAATVDAGREEVRAHQADAVRRIDELDSEERALAHRLSVMETIYDELQETLVLVAETAIKDLVQAQDSLKQLDPIESRHLVAEQRNSKDTTSGSASAPGLAESARAIPEPPDEDTHQEADRSVREARTDNNEPDHGRLPSESLLESDGDGKHDVAVTIDDRDSEQRQPRHKRWLSQERTDRDSKTGDARQDDAVSERFSRILSSSNSVEGADPDKVEARLRNLTHGTNGE